MIRNGWKRGDYLMRDDILGDVIWASEAVKRYDGIIMRRSGNEDEIPDHPQLYVKPLNDPRALKDIRPDTHSAAVVASNVVDINGVPIPRGAAQHQFVDLSSGAADPTTIPNMRIQDDSGSGVNNPFTVA